MARGRICPVRCRRAARLVPPGRRCVLAGPVRRPYAQHRSRDARNERPGTVPRPADLGNSEKRHPSRQGRIGWQFEPWAKITHRCYADGELPLWNPYQAFGAPLAANMQSAVFDPLLLAVNLHPTPLMWDLSIVGAFVLGAAAAFVFGRVLGLRVEAAVVTSAAFSLSGWFFLYCNNVFSRSYVYLPLLFLLVELVLRSRRLLPVFLLGVAVAGKLYVGMPEASFLVLGTRPRMQSCASSRSAALCPASPFARLGGAGLLGFLLAAPLLLLFLQYESLSFNVHSSGVREGVGGGSAVGAPELVDPVLPVTAHRHLAECQELVRRVGRDIGARRHVGPLGDETTAHLAVRRDGAPSCSKVYEFRVSIGSGGFRFSSSSSSGVRAAGRLVRVCGARGNRRPVVWSRDLVLRRFLILLAVGIRTAGRLRTHGRSLGDDRERSTGLRADGLGSRPSLRRARGRGILASAWLRPPLWSACSSPAVIVVELLVLVPFDIYSKRADPFLEPGWMPLVAHGAGGRSHAACSGSTASSTRTPRARSACRTFGRSTRCTRARTCATSRRSSSAGGVRPVHGDASRPSLPRQPDVRRARRAGRPLAAMTSRTRRRCGCRPRRDTRVYENTNAYPRAWVVHDVHVVEGEDEAFGFLEAHARRKDGAFIVDTFDPRREAVVEHDGKSRRTTPCDALQGGRDAMHTDDPTVRHRALLRETPCPFASRRRAPACSSSRTPISRVGRRR